MTENNFDKQDEQLSAYFENLKKTDSHKKTEIANLLAQEKISVPRSPIVFWKQMAAALVLVALFVFWQHGQKDMSSALLGWNLHVNGTTQILEVGEWFESSTDKTTLDVADIGYVTVKKGSRLRIKVTDKDEHRLELQHGHISAMVTAPPRLFLVDTPAVQAVDMGCAYDLGVDNEGTTRLHVSLGWVAFEVGQYPTYIPEGASCECRKGEKPGTPYFEKSNSEFKETLAYIDRILKSSKELTKVELNELKILFGFMSAQDTLSLWHLLPKSSEELRPLICQQLEKFSPWPQTIDTNKIQQLDLTELEELYDHLYELWY